MKRLTALAAAAFLTACGGGGGGETAATGTAEGFWNGTVGGYNASLAILENGETWGLYTSAGSLVGALYGNTSSSGTSLTGSGSSFNFVDRTSGSGTYTGSVAQKNTLSLTTNDGTKFVGNYSAAYDQKASLVNLAGTYTGFSVTATTPAQTVPVTISVNGEISASFVSGNLSCTASGTVTPRSSNKNIFNVQVTFTGNYCALGNGTTTTGIAYYNTATREIGVMTLNGAKSDGFVYVGVR